MKNWLPNGKKAAICFSIDDIHPAKSSDYYEAGGDMENGGLGLVQWLLDRHKDLKVTLFVTADWREISPFPTRKLLARIPYLRDYFFLTKRWKKGKMALDNHPDFVKYLNKMDRAEIALHGLHHVHKGLKIPVEFQNQTSEEFKKIIIEMLRIFDKSRINYVKGICPPGWNAPENLMNELIENNINFIASSRDIFTDIQKDALTNMSGLKNLPLIYPTMLKNDKLVHIPSNFHATSKIDRALEIIENGGLLSIKAHIIKDAFGYISYDGIDETYINYLDVLLSHIEKEYGDSIWWTSMDEISTKMHNNLIL
jgi:hypothetical protein